MKKALLLGIAISTLTFTACKKSKNEETDVFKLGYSNLSVEEQKKQIEQSGIEFINQINTLPEEKSVQTLTHLAELDLPEPSGFVKGLEGIALSSRQKNTAGILEATTKVNAETVVKLSEQYGIYNWNKNTGKWVFTASTTRLEYQFPSSSESTTNDATLSITYTASTTKKAIDGGYMELPATANASLKVNSKEELKYTSSYQYTADGMPSKTEVNVVMGSFNAIYNLSETGTDAGFSFSLAKEKQTLLAFSAAAKGNVDFNQDDASLLTNANASFQIMNVKVAGQVDYKAIDAGESTITGTSEYAVNQKLAELYNKNTKLVVVDAKENKTFAKVEFVADPDLNTRLVFKDGSKQSFDEFFATGFEDLLSMGFGQ